MLAMLVMIVRSLVSNVCIVCNSKIEIKKKMKLLTGQIKVYIIHYLDL